MMPSADETGGTEAGPGEVDAAGPAFAVMNGRKLAFSEPRQEIYELNDTAAYIWYRLADGDAPAAIIDGLAGLGISPETADAYVRDALAVWARLAGAGRAGLGTAARGGAQPQVIHVAGLVVRIRYDRPSLARIVAPAFAHLAAKSPAAHEVARADVSLEILAEGTRFRLQADGVGLDAWGLDELLPALKAQLTAAVLAHGRYALAIHAAALAHRDRMLLLGGEAGAGKTTLALALAHAGFGYAGDDIALLTPTGRVAGVPFAAAVKSDAWGLVSWFRPELETVRTCLRSDGQHVRYLPPSAPPVIEPLPLGWVVLLRRQPRRAAASLAPLDKVDAMRMILAEATAPGERLRTAAFGQLVQAMAGAQCYVLHYARLEDAVRELQRGCA
ncbi:PqqD family protein [Inquilinus sp. Marseille-Q2685]|uniref:PqqD family protein n=1 Tax=Inquilinus sp. Marseille-Q2685 TaxID=2866581 RepID=UPI001CE476DA|nr:PqqD family protein [Inquilinus sp. Marseille-Q2685]